MISTHRSIITPSLKTPSRLKEQAENSYTGTDNFIYYYIRAGADSFIYNNI
jgi:hypothetical protein